MNKTYEPLSDNAQWFFPKDYHGTVISLSRTEMKKQLKKDFPLLFNIFSRHERIAKKENNA